MIREERRFRDDTGRRVMRLAAPPAEPLFIGILRVRSKDNPFLEKDFEFAFPEDVTGLESAFARFDEVASKRMAEHNDKIKKPNEKQPELSL